MKVTNIIRTILLAMSLILSVQSHAQETLEDEWWVSIKGKTKGAAKLIFSDLLGGTFKVTGYGTTLSLGEFFLVSPNQTLQRASNGKISGTLAIEDENGDSLGTFEFEKGRVNKAFTVLHLKGNLVSGGTVPVKVVGKRFLSENPVLAGLTMNAKVGGKGLKSKFFELLVLENEGLAAPFSSFPFFTYAGIGPVKVDGVEIDSIAVLGELVIDSNFRAYGTFSSEEFGSGPVRGRLQEGETANIPRIKLTAEANRTVTLRGNLETPVSPRISVEPSSGLDFDSVDTGATKDLSFTVTNTGDGTLSGSASIGGTGSPYTIVSGSPYSLASGAAGTVAVRFSPTATGTFAEDITFTGGGGTVGTVTGVGTDPSGTLSVDPADTLVFGDVLVADSDIRTFTVTNTGSADLVGEATIAGASAFQLVNDLDEVVTMVPYSLGTAAATTVRVRFSPVVLGEVSAIVSFTGGMGAAPTVTGSGAAP